MRTTGMALLFVLGMICLIGCQISANEQKSELQAQQLLAQGRFEEADSVYRATIIDLEKMHGPDSWQLAVACTDYGAILMTQNRWEEAGRWSQRSVDIWNTLDVDDTMPSEYVSERARALGNLSSVCQKRGELQEAEKFAVHALAILENVVASDHPDVLSSLYNLGYLYQQQERFAEAESLMTRAVQLARQSQRHDISEIAPYTYQLARIHQVQGQHHEAIRIFRSALEFAKTAPDAVPHGLEFYRSGLAFALLDVDSIAVALPMFESCFAETCERLGDSSIECAMRAANLAGCYMRMERYADAWPLYERSLAIYEKSAYYHDHPSVSELREARDLCRQKSGS